MGYHTDYGLPAAHGCLWILCELEWPTFHVGWLSEGSLDPLIVRKIWNVVTGRPGHPDQFPYIDQWLYLVLNPPKWLWKCLKDISKLAKVLALQETRGSQGHHRQGIREFSWHPSAPILLPSDEGEILPPPYTSHGPQTPSHSFMSSPRSPEAVLSSSEGHNFLVLRGKWTLDGNDGVSPISSRLCSHEHSSSHSLAANFPGAAPPPAPIIPMLPLPRGAHRERWNHCLCLCPLYNFIYI